MDFKNMGAKKVMVVTDSTVLNLDAMKQVSEGLEREGVKFEVFSNVRVEPKDYSYVVFSAVLRGPNHEREYSLMISIGFEKLLTTPSRMHQMLSLLLVVEVSWTRPS